MFVTEIRGRPTNPRSPPGPGIHVMHPQPLSKCAPGTCFRQDMCIPLESGAFQCAPCPDGYTGDGVHCDDVDEVGIRCCWLSWISCKWLLQLASSVLMFQCQLNPCFPGVPCVNTAPGFRCGKCPLGYTGPEITGVGVSYAKTHKQVQQPKQFIVYIIYILFGKSLPAEWNRNCFITCSIFFSYLCRGQLEHTQNYNNESRSKMILIEQPT